MKKPVFLFISALLLTPSSFGVDSPKDQLQKAREEAAKGKKDVFIVFSGASWDPVSKGFEEKILNVEEFQKGIEKDFVDVLINIPPTREEAHGDLLEFEKSYRFQNIPTVILADSEARPYASTGGEQQSPAEYLKQLGELRKIRVERDQSFAAALKAQGIERAGLLVKALKTLPQETVAEFYGKELEMIAKADPKNETKYAGEIKKEQAVKAERARYNELFVARNYDQIIKDSRAEGAGLKLEDAQRLKMYEVQALYAQKKYDEALKAVKELEKFAPESDLGKRSEQIAAQIEGAKSRSERAKEAANKPKAPIVSKPVAIVTDIELLRKDAKKTEEELAEALVREKAAAAEKEALAQEVAKMQEELESLQAKAKATVETFQEVSAEREKLARKAKAMKEVVENHEAMEKRKREISELEKRAAELQKQADDLRKKAGDIRKGK